jgi:integrase
VLSRNPASSGRPPAAEDEEVRILSPSEIMAVLDALRDHPFFPIVSLALATGMRRGELLGLQWRDIVGTKIRVERQLHQTKAGSSRFGPPKGKKGKRTITIPSDTVDMLAEHRSNSSSSA